MFRRNFSNQHLLNTANKIHPWSKTIEVYSQGDRILVKNYLAHLKTKQSEIDNENLSTSRCTSSCNEIAKKESFTRLKEIKHLRESSEHFIDYGIVNKGKSLYSNRLWYWLIQNGYYTGIFLGPYGVWRLQHDCGIMSCDHPMFLSFYCIIGWSVVSLFGNIMYADDPKTANFYIKHRNQMITELCRKEELSNFGSDSNEIKPEKFSSNQN